MDEKIAELLLAEFREFRASVGEWQQGMGERVSSIETTIKPAIQGNGQPSRLTVVETRVTDLERLWWKCTGASTAVWVLLTIALHFIPWGKH